MSSRLGRITGIIGTILVHVLVILLVMWHPKKNPPPPPPPVIQQQITVDLIPYVKPAVPKTEETVKLPDQDLKKMIQLPSDPVICKDRDNTYIGIGIRYDVSMGVITHAPEYYPGYKAGLRVGDMILNPGEDAVNGRVKLHIVRSHLTTSYTIKTEKICFQRKVDSDK